MATHSRIIIPTNAIVSKLIFIFNFPLNKLISIYKILPHTMKQAFQPHFQSIYSIYKNSKTLYIVFFYLFKLPLPPSRKFNVQCVAESSIFACVGTLCVLLITYSSSPSVAVIKPSGLFNSSLANAWLVLIISKISFISFRFNCTYLHNICRCNLLLFP